MSFLLTLLVTIALCAQESEPFKFPVVRPDNGNINRPGDGEVLTVSPPGFCWWRAGERGRVSYRLHVFDDHKNEVCTSGFLDDPAFIPENVLQPGTYTWIVDAVTKDGVLRDTRRASSFVIASNAASLPWLDAEILLNRVSKEHPRLLFPKATLGEIRKTLTTTRRSAFESLKVAADEGLGLPSIGIPDFDRYTSKRDNAAKRTAYRDAYRKFIDLYNGHVVPMALMYLFTGEKRYGEEAKRHLLNLLDWPLDGVTSVSDPRFDEIGLNIAHSIPQIYDWCYDLFSENEHGAIEKMLIARGTLLFERLQRRDFLNTPGESHDGRVPGYLLEFSILFADRAEATSWMEYGMKALLTVFPHWGGMDGGWAEGIDYALSYNDRFITPLHSVYVNTGYDLWQKSFFRNFPYFLVYCLSPIGEISPFGDMEHIGIANRAGSLSSLLLYYANHYNDPTLHWWVDLFRANANVQSDGQAAVHRLALADTVSSIAPTNAPLDIAFSSVGWAALHSAVTQPDRDLLVLFKSSPYGPDSHSHADQNSFAIMKAGKALALPSGARFPQQGSPFHTKYTTKTLAHNAILVNGKGQLDRDQTATGKLVAFRSLPHIGYAAGEAQNSYGEPVQRYLRHVVLIRPSVILIVDELESTEPIQVDWLMHGKEQFEMNEKDQTLLSHRAGKQMKVHLFTAGGFKFHQDDVWPIDPLEGYSMVTAAPPEKQWHFDAQTQNKSQRVRIACLMVVSDGNEKPDVLVRSHKDGVTEISARFAGVGRVDVTINVSPSPKGIGEKSILDIRYLSVTGETEHLSVPE
ncbi:MAG: DUF4962 domain-containing protein [Bacteroidota bacterium]